jgi:tRNA(Ile)-lysidine synthase
MHDFTRNFLTEWRKLNLPFEGKTFVAAVSGGADSCALALALNDLRRREKLKLRFVLAHFNHDLRGAESDEDEKFVRDLAVRYNFELAVGRGELREQKGNLEQSARRARYNFLRATAENLRAEGVLTAHTVNDQAETFLLNLIRGSGIEGLSGMKPVRSLESRVESPEFEEKSEIPNPKSQILLVRPLLNWAKRADTENFCRENSLEYRYDSMNEDLAFKRVRIRRVLLPLLQDFNPRIVEALANTANLLRDEAELLQELTREFDKAEISVGELKNLSSPLRRRILRLWLARERGDVRRLETVHLEAIENLILSEKSGRTVELPGGASVVKKDGEIKFKKTVEKS